MSLQIVVDEAAVLAVLGIGKGGQKLIGGQTAAIALAGRALERLRKIFNSPRHRVDSELLVARKDDVYALDEREHLLYGKAVGYLLEIVAYRPAHAVDPAVGVVILLLCRVCVAAAELGRIADSEIKRQLEFVFIIVIIVVIKGKFVFFPILLIPIIIGVKGKFVLLPIIVAVLARNEPVAYAIARNNLAAFKIYGKAVS